MGAFRALKRLRRAKEKAASKPSLEGPMPDQTLKDATLDEITARMNAQAIVVDRLGDRYERSRNEMIGKQYDFEASKLAAITEEFDVRWQALFGKRLEMPVEKDVS